MEMKNRKQSIIAELLLILPMGYYFPIERMTRKELESALRRIVQLIISASLLGLLLLPLCGCESYQKSNLTPDGFNYTLAVDHQDLNVSQHWFGLTWNLKPSK